MFENAIAQGSFTQQKLNSNSFTESKLVPTSYSMLQVLLTRKFLVARTYGKGLYSKRTRHINILYYFITDKTSEDDLSVECCQTEVMALVFLQAFCRAFSSSR